MRRFDGRVVIITGIIYFQKASNCLVVRMSFVLLSSILLGSSSGIGQHAAVEFGKEGAIVAIHGQSAERLKVNPVGQIAVSSG